MHAFILCFLFLLVNKLKFKKGSTTKLIVMLPMVIYLEGAKYSLIKDSLLFLAFFLLKKSSLTTSESA